MNQTANADMIQRIVARQREYFRSGATRPVSARIKALKKLQQEIRNREGILLDALKADLHKCPFEGYMCEVGMCLDELGYLIKNTPQWAKPQKRPTPIAQFKSKSYELPEPYGVTLVMSPWNYPILLSLDPVFGAVAAGNCVILKPSAYAPHTSRALAKLIQAVFDPGWVTVIEGGREQNSALLEQRFDYIFFTGSVDVGKLVMEKASRHLTPVTLELGGKSPVIVDKTANIPLTAKRLAFG
ncbi:MAG: aldehyde dehydrogenase family protein, partial [Ruminiclostridium sp.]|nr:aldehyde dehydrogenase family protein [Ruminiclostridium sp.]